MGTLNNKDMLQMVQPGLGEFQNHRVHFLVTVQTLKPSIITRALILAIQFIALPIHFLACLFYAPICESRDVLLEKCRRATKCEYLLPLDADMLLCKGPCWKDDCLDARADVYMLVQVSSLEYGRVCN